MHLLVILLLLDHVTVLNVLPLAALVPAVPDLVGGDVEGKLESEGTGKSSGQENSVLADEGRVDSVCEASHCERLGCFHTT